MVSRFLVRYLHWLFLTRYSPLRSSTSVLVRFSSPADVSAHSYRYPSGQPAIDDPHKVVKVVASDGKSGETREISYSNCKVIGNGSFGVVFQAKIVGAPKEGEDI